MTEVVVPPVTGEAPKSPVSPKVVFATIASFLAPALLLTLNFLLTPEGQNYFAGLDPIWVVLITGLLTSGATFLASWLKRDPIRELGVGVAPRRALIEDNAGF